jgi:hypothetical protein
MTAAAGVFIPGVEEALPAGERVLWHGKPARHAVARHVFHVRALAAYFGALVLVRLLSANGGTSPAAQAIGVALFVAVAVGAVGLFTLVSEWIARSTVYAITDGRVVLKIGMAMPMTLNIPLRCIESAGVREWRDGTGEIALTLRGPDRFAYMMLWPHARPWQFARPQPTLRGLVLPREVGATLAAAVRAAGDDVLEGAPALVERPAPAGRLVPPARLAG